jgi:hypothetical protein
MSAIMSHFVLADMNQDGLTDIGVVREEIQCPASDYGESEHPTYHGPVYRQLPVAWCVKSDEASPSATRSCGSYLRQVIPHQIQANVWHSKYGLIRGNPGQN